MRILRSLYCDDIRQEMGGKVSLMGVYTGVMYLSEMPALLPRICIHSSLSVPIEDSIEQLLFELVIDGNVVLTIPGKLPPESTAPVDLLASPVARTVTIGAILSPFAVEKPCLLETRIRIVNDIVQGSRLHVLKAKTGDYTPQPITLPGR